MSQFAPAALTAAQYEIARRTLQGGEFQAWVSPDTQYTVGRIAITAVDTCEWTPDAAFSAALSATPSDLVAMVLDEPVKPSANVVLTLTGTDQASASETFVATFANPPWAGVSQRVFTPGYSVDFIASPTTNKCQTITSVACTAPAEAVGAIFTVVRLPLLTTFERIGCTTQNNFTPKSRPPVAMPCGMNGSAFTAKGVSRPGQLTITADHASMGLGLTRFVNTRLTAMLKPLKDGTVESERLFFTGYYISPEVTSGAGEDRASASSQGFFEELLHMYAGL